MQENIYSLIRHNIEFINIIDKISLQAQFYYTNCHGYHFVELINLAAVLSTCWGNLFGSNSITPL